MVAPDKQGAGIRPAGLGAQKDGRANAIRAHLHPAVGVFVSALRHTAIDSTRARNLSQGGWIRLRHTVSTKTWFSASLSRV